MLSNTRARLLAPALFICSNAIGEQCSPGNNVVSVTQDPPGSAAQVSRGALRQVARITTRSDSELLIATSRIQQGEEWHLGVAAFRAKPGRVTFSDPLDAAWAIDLGAVPAVEIPRLYGVSSLNNEETRVLVSYADEPQTSIIDGKSGKILGRITGVSFMDAVSAEKGTYVQMLFRKGNAIGLLSSLAQLTQTLDATIKVGGVLVAGAIVRPSHTADDKRQNRIVFASVTEAATDGDGTARGSLTVWGAYVTNEGQLGQARPLLTLDLARSNAEVGLIANDDAGFVLLPSYDRRGGAVVPFDVDALVPENVPATSFIRDPDDLAEDSYQWPAFGTASIRVGNSIIISRPGDFERSAIFAFNVKTHEECWRIVFPVGQNAGTQLHLEGSNVLLVAGGGTGTAALSGNGAVSRLQMDDTGPPSLIETLYQNDLTPMILNAIEFESEEGDDGG